MNFNWIKIFAILGCLSLGLAGCSSSGESPDIPEFVSIGQYSANFCSFCKQSRLPKLKPKPILRISQNHPRMATSPWHLNAFPYAVAYALYDNLNDDAAIRSCITRRYPTSRLEQSRDYADILFWRKPIDGREYSHITNLRRINPNLTETPIAKDALVFFTHKDNPVSNLSLSQIRDIYSGKISNWQMVGGNVESIIPYQRQSMWDGFYALSQEIMRFDVMRGLQMIPAAKQHVSNISGYSRNEVVEYKNSPGALGYSVRWSMETVVPKKRLKQIKILSVDGVFPNEENISNGSYPIVYDIVAFAVKRDISAETNMVISWLVSSEGKQYIRRLGYVPY